PRPEHHQLPTLPRAHHASPFPYTTLFRSLRAVREPFRVTGRAHALIPGTSALYELEDVRGYEAMTLQRYFDTYPAWCIHQPAWLDRKSTRLNSSHVAISYAVFCLIQKNVD